MDQSQETVPEAVGPESPEAAADRPELQQTAQQANPTGGSGAASQEGVSPRETPSVSGVRDPASDGHARAAVDEWALFSHLAAAAGVRDLAEGAELLDASDDLGAMSAVVSGISAEDLEDAMDLAAISGQLAAASDIVTELDMPVLAAFLSDRGRWLREIAVDTVVRFGATRALSALMEETGWQLDDLAVDEIAEGLEELAGAEALAERELLAGAAADLTGKGQVEVL